MFAPYRACHAASRPARALHAHGRGDRGRLAPRDLPGRAAQRPGNAGGLEPAQRTRVSRGNKLRKPDRILLALLFDDGGARREEALAWLNTHHSFELQIMDDALAEFGPKLKEALSAEGFGDGDEEEEEEAAPTAQGEQEGTDACHKQSKDVYGLIVCASEYVKSILEQGTVREAQFVTDVLSQRGARRFLPLKYERNVLAILRRVHRPIRQELQRKMAAALEDWVTSAPELDLGDASVAAKPSRKRKASAVATSSDCSSSDEEEDEEAGEEAEEKEEDTNEAKMEQEESESSGDNRRRGRRKVVAPTRGVYAPSTAAKGKISEKRAAKKRARRQRKMEETLEQRKTEILPEQTHSEELLALRGQSEIVWAVRQAIEETFAEDADQLREMGDVNGMTNTNRTHDDRLVAAVADGILFGIPEACPECSGSLEWSGCEYKCSGHLDEWTKCSYTNKTPSVTPWSIPTQSGKGSMLPTLRTALSRLQPEVQVSKRGQCAPRARVSLADLADATSATTTRAPKASHTAVATRGKASAAVKSQRFRGCKFVVHGPFPDAAPWLPEPPSSSSSSSSSASSSSTVTSLEAFLQAAGAELQPATQSDTTCVITSDNVLEQVLCTVEDLQMRGSALARGAETADTKRRTISEHTERLASVREKMEADLAAHEDTAKAQRSKAMRALIKSEQTAVHQLQRAQEALEAAETLLAKKPGLTEEEAAALVAGRNVALALMRYTPVVTVAFIRACVANASVVDLAGVEFRLQRSIGPAHLLILSLTVHRVWDADGVKALSEAEVDLAAGKPPVTAQTRRRSQKHDTVITLGASQARATGKAATLQVSRSDSCGGGGGGARLAIDPFAAQQLPVQQRHMRILEDGGKRYAAAMILADVARGTNKFYILQAIDVPTEGAVFVFRRYGNMGEDGKHLLQRMWHPQAVKLFKRLFRERTGNDWASGSYPKRPGKYLVTDSSFGSADQGKSSAATADPGAHDDTEEAVTEDSLDPDVQRLMAHLLDKKTVSRDVEELQVDLTRLPMGIISEKQLELASRTLDELIQVLDLSPAALARASARAAYSAGGEAMAGGESEQESKQQEQELEQEQEQEEDDENEDAEEEEEEGEAEGDEEPRLSAMQERKVVALSNRFYMQLPHAQTNLPMLATAAQVQEKLALVEQLLDMARTQALIRKSSRQSPSSSSSSASSSSSPSACTAKPWLTAYRQLRVRLFSLPPSSAEFKRVADYFTSTVTNTHSEFDKCRVVHVFGVDKAAENSTFDSKYGSWENRRLLWHGTSTACVPSILKTGFRLPSRGGMFGKGIYFANASSKSTCYSHSKCWIMGETIFLFLCEVALGPMYVVDRWHPEHYQLTRARLPSGKQSTHGRGLYTPRGETFSTESGATYQHGPFRTNGGRPNRLSSLQLDEFIVYDPKMVRFRYLVQLTREARPDLY